LKTGGGGAYKKHEKKEGNKKSLSGVQGGISGGGKESRERGGVEPNGGGKTKGPRARTNQWLAKIVKKTGGRKKERGATPQTPTGGAVLVGPDMGVGWGKVRTNWRTNSQKKTKVGGRGVRIKIKSQKPKKTKAFTAP